MNEVDLRDHVTAPRSLDLRDHLAEAENTLLDFACLFLDSDNEHRRGVGEGMAVAAVEIRRILSLQEANRMRKNTWKPPAPGIRQDGEANRALRRAHAKGKPWAVAAVAEAARNLRLAWFVAGQLVGGGLWVPEAEAGEEAA